MRQPCAPWLKIGLGTFGQALEQPVDGPSHFLSPDAAFPLVHHYRELLL
jgi:hypothetical protein